MESNLNALQKNEKRAEKELLTALSLKEPAINSVEHLISRYRSACESLIFLDFEAAAQERAEERLWEAHLKINKMYRPILAYFRKDEGKKKHVERRKMEKHFLDFIKSSMRFYRGYIQRLASHFTNIPEVAGIAQKFNLDTLSVDTPVSPDPNLRQHLIQSCHATLIRLGDLSRYRETELQTKERNWGPAKGYYDLATVVNPTSGASYNQLAVIALADHDHLRAVYFLHRAISVKTPFPTAQANLELEFKKIRDRQAKSQLITELGAKSPGVIFQANFLAIHAECYNGNHSETQETTVLSQLVGELSGTMTESALNKIIVTNVAAEFLAKRRVEADSKHIQSFNCLQQLNVHTFYVLCQTLIFDLEKSVEAGGVSPVEESESKQSSQLSLVTRRLLPLLRQYSSWLVATVELLLAQEQQPLASNISKMWKSYAKALTLLSSTFKVLQIAEIDYLLDEDQDTVAFEPFADPIPRERFLDAKGQLKKSKVADGVRHHPNDEMLFRIRDLVKQGVKLIKRPLEPPLEPVPIVYAQSQFIYQDPGLGSQEKLGSPLDAHMTLATRNSILLEGSVSDDPSLSMSSAMQTMVDDLVSAGSRGRRGAARPTSRTPNTFNAQHLVRQMQRSSNPASPQTEQFEFEPAFPALPSIMNTPFAPRAGETTTSAALSSSRPGTAGLDLPASSAPAASLRSGEAAFRADLVKQQQEILMRSSPPQPPTSSWAFYDTSQAMESAIRPARTDRSSPLLPSPSAPHSAIASPGVGTSSSNHPSPQRAQFGAIGQPRPSSMTPTCAQDNQRPSAG